MKKLKTIRKGLAYQIIRLTVLFLLIFGVVLGAISYVVFTNSLTTEYNDSAFRTAETAATMINADAIETYLAGGLQEEYAGTLAQLDSLCNKQNVTLLYTIYVDTSDYNHFRSVFNSVNENSGYTPWELGHLRETTNEEYRQIYINIYEHGSQRETVSRTTGLNGAEPHITSLIPLKGSDGAVKAILCVQRPMSELKRGREAYQIRSAIATVAALLVTAAAAGFFISRQIVLPIQKVSREAERFAGGDGNVEAATLGHISGINEVNTLAASIEKMEDDTLRYISNLTRVTAERERIGTELNVATQIQADMLPRIFPAFPEREEFDIFASMTPAKEVGGDFYDFFLIDDDHLAMVIADVSGKGVPAALFMVIAKTLIKNRALMGGTPAEILAYVNGQLCEGNEAGLFVTVWLAILELSTGRGMAANAGHEHPAIRRGKGSFELVKYRHSPAVATMEGMHFREHEFQLHPGDALYVYTDGVTEATNANNVLFGEDRVVEALNRNPSAPPREILQTVKDAIDDFVGDAVQFDDITMLGMDYFG